jgi:hypothetical protein
MDGREERGMRIAATCNLVKKGRAWLVPSQSGKGRYTVVPDAVEPHCTCLDHGEGGHKCKHIFAVEYAIQREENPDGSTTVVQTVTVTEKIEKRKTYPQVWPAYNAAQTHEKEHFLDLLADLCRGVQNPPQEGKGRPRIPAADAIFAACYKVYSTFSGRRFMSDLREAQSKGYIDHTPHFNSIFNSLENPELTPILHSLIIQTSLPMRAVEVDFAVDSSGFTTSRFVRWYDHKYGCVRQQHGWVKVHLICGVKNERRHGRGSQGQRRQRFAASPAASERDGRKLHGSGSIRRLRLQQPQKLRSGRRLGRYGVHRLQGQREWREGRVMGEDVPLLLLPPGRIHVALPQAEQRGIDVQYDKGEVPRPRSEQGRSGDDERSPLQDRLP